MKINKGAFALSVAAGVFLAGSMRGVSKLEPRKLPAYTFGLNLTPQLSVDSFKIKTLKYMDDGPVLPKIRLK